jgi:hypothetical protein
MGDLVDAICEPRRSDECRASREHDRVPELLRLIGQRDRVAPESSSARARTGASAPLRSSGVGDISASLGQRSEPFGPGRDNSELWCRGETAYPYGDPLAATASARSPRRPQASARQAHESARETSAAVRAYAWPTYRGHGKTTAGRNPGTEVSGPPDKHPLLRWARVTGSVSSAIVGTAAALRAYAWQAYQGHGKTAAGDNPGAEVSGRPDNHPLLRWARVTGSVSSAIVGTAAALRAYAWQAHQRHGKTAAGVSSAIAGLSAALRAYAWRAYQRHGKTAAGVSSAIAGLSAALCANAWPAFQAHARTAADGNAGAEISGLPARHPLLWWPRVSGGGSLAIAGIAGSVLIGALAAVGYYALGASNATGPAPAIAHGSIKAKATAAAQSDAGEARNMEPPKTFGSDQPNKVRTVTIRPDVGAANMSAAQSSTNVDSELSTSAVPGARRNSAERRDVGAASTPAAAFAYPRSKPNIPPAPPARANADAQKNVRAGAARPQVAARSGGKTCQVSPGSGGYWAWRMIDGRKCWYEGRPGISKDSLRWVRRAA